MSVEVPTPGGDRRRLLDHVSLELGPGEFVALVGPNGAGKTTLLRVLAGLLRPTAGEVRLDGAPLMQLRSRPRARRLGLVPQAAAPAIDFTCLDVVLMGRYPYLRRLEAEGPADVAAAREALREVEMSEMEPRLTSTLSAGERQRVVFARGRCQQPECLLCDEPTSNLDLRHRALVFSTLAEFTGGGGTVLAAVHDLDLAARYCGRLVLMAGGRVLADGTPTEVLTVERLRKAYGVETVVQPDPATGSPHVTVLGPADHHPHI